MKTLLTTIAIGCHLVFGFASCSYGQAYFLGHSGANDPASEGFSSSPYFHWQTLPVTNDFGYNAWSTTVNASSGSYWAIVGSSLVANNWTLAVHMRVVSPGNSGYFNAVVDQGASAYYLYFGAAPNGNQLVTINNYQSISLPGGGIYHKYELEFDSQTGLASLWIDGVERISSISGLGNYPPPQNPQGGWAWGGGTQFPSVSQANWNLVSLEVIPEPASFCLLGLGCGILLGLRRSRL